MKQVAAYDSKSKDRPPASIDDAIEDIAANTGLYILMQKRGFTRAQLKSCLVDKPSREKILAMTQEAWEGRSEEHTSELQSLMRISYAVFCLKKKKNPNKT